MVNPAECKEGRGAEISWMVHFHFVAEIHYCAGAERGGGEGLVITQLCR